MELTKQDTQKAKGVAILGMIMLHLFCRLGELPYTPLIWMGSTPLIYYLGLFGDICVPIYCFCSGYAHYLLREQYGCDYYKRIPGKLLKFLGNFWIVVILFSLVGVIFCDDAIPGSVSDFIGNIFLYRLSYNGAWWFVLTYVFLLLLSPLFARFARKIPSACVLIFSLVIYFVAYLFRFKFQLEIENPVLNWILTQVVLLGTSQFGYMIGMVCRKERFVSKLRACFSCRNEITDMSLGGGRVLPYLIVICLPVAAFAGHCLVQSVFVAPFTAITVLVSLSLVKLPRPIDTLLLFFGKHSTNIWLVHMFFYLTLFEGFVFRAKFPLIILGLMLIVCLVVSWVVNWIYEVVEKCVQLGRQRALH